MADEQEVLGRLAQVAADLGPAITPPGHQEVLDSIAQTAHELTGAAATSIAALRMASGELEFVSATGPSAEAVVGLRMPADKGIAGWAIASGQSLSVGEVMQDPRFARDVADVTGYLPQTIFAIPLEGEHGTVGVFEILDADPARAASTGVADDREVSAVVAILAQQAALALGTVQLFQDLGTVLLTAAARAATDGDIELALARTAAAATGPSKQLAQLLAVFSELGQLGDDERQTAAKILYDFLGFARRAGT